MKISINGVLKSVSANNLETILIEAGYGEMRVATALNGIFVPGERRAEFQIEEGDQFEVVTPRQGG